MGEELNGLYQEQSLFIETFYFYFYFFLQTLFFFQRNVTQ